jgi:hypothetical protein
MRFQAFGQCLRVHQADRAYTLRRDEKSAEMIDKKRVERLPLGKRVCKNLKRKGIDRRHAETFAGLDLRTSGGAPVPVVVFFDAEC